MIWQAITFITIFAAIGIAILTKNGEDKGKYSFRMWLIAFSWLLAFGIEFYLLYSAGFFDKVN